MNNSDLEKKLKSARVPERTQEYWDDFPQQVTRSLRTAVPGSAGFQPAGSVDVETRRQDGGAPKWQPKLAWGFGVAFACLVIGFAIGHRHGKAEADSFALLQNEKMLHEVLTMFPNRVRAIEQDEHGVRLVLSDDADVPTSTPLWIKICEGKNCRVVVTFSGQDLQIAKERVEVLMDARGQVLLVGNNFVWSSADPTRATDHLRIQARPLSDVM
jgi:hypothetical protein